MKKFGFTWLKVSALVALMALLLGNFGVANAQGGSQTFPETGHTVSGRFLQYWQANGGLAQQGYPISEPMQEVSQTDGKAYTVQYFERAVFEMHPENAQPYDVLLSQLGKFQYRSRYGTAGAPGQTANNNNGRVFPETGFTVGGAFRDYWEQHGGLAQQGYPISNEFQEVSQTDGKTYTVQYFERAVFELHPENQAPYNVLLSQLGKFQYRARYQGGGGTTPAQPTTPPAQPTTPPTTGGNNGPQDVDAAVDPRCGVAGTTFRIAVGGFVKDEPISYWITAPSGDVIGTSHPFSGSHDTAFLLGQIQTDASFAQLPGYWAITVAGAYSKHQSIGYFYIATNAADCAGK